MTREMLQVEDLFKKFRSKKRHGMFRSERKTVHALRGVSLSVPEGEFFGLLGPNGAGKTTLIKIITTLLIPDSGRVIVNGYDASRQEDMVRASIGCMLMGDRGLYWKLTGRENLDYFGALHMVPRAVRRRRIEELIGLLELDEFIDRQVESYSSGQKMMTAFAKALFHKAPILILDEPTVTMDVNSSRRIKKVLKEVNGEGHTIIYTTHLMQEAEELCDRVAIIDHGEIIALGTPAELRARLGREDIMNVEGTFPPGGVDAVCSLPGVNKAYLSSKERESGRLTVHCRNARMLMPEVIRLILTSGGNITYVSSREATLEDVFVSLTGRTLADGEA